LNVNERIKELAKTRGWSQYRLVQETGLPQSTISNMFSRDTVPSIATLESICAAFGISLSQFFAEGNFVALTPEQEEVLGKWTLLTAEQKRVCLDLFSVMNPDG